MNTQTGTSRLELIKQDGLLFTYRDRTSKLYVTLFNALDDYWCWITEYLDDEENAIVKLIISLDDFDLWQEIAFEAIDNLPPKESNSDDQLQLDFLEQVP